jgi:glycosyltransferase involved in cell wall biosynthesis
MSNILFLVEDMFGCGWYRCAVPGMELGELGHQAQLINTMEYPDLSHCDVLVLQRPSNRNKLKAAIVARKRGIKLVVDLDDDLWSIAHSNPAHEGWNTGERLMIIEECLRLADVVTTTTPELRELLLKFNDNVVVLPNMIPHQHWPSERFVRVPDGKIVIGWAGSPTHYEDLELLAGSLETILDRNENVEVKLCGTNVFPFREHPRISTIPPAKVEDYHAVPEQFDIAIAPIKDTRFNRCKSDLKVIEFSAIGLPIVASDVAPYHRSIEHGVNGYLAKNAKDWIKYLERLVRDGELRRTMGDNARAFAETRMMHNNVLLWERAYGIEHG